MIKENENLKFIYEIVMILHDKENCSLEERIDRAYRYYNKSDEYKKECFGIFNNYVLGGIEVIYDKIINSKKDINDIIESIMDFITEFNDAYNDDNIDDILNQYK